MTLTVASMFSGIGLIDLGLERAGMETRVLCESDKAARSVLARRFPGVPTFPDVRELTADDLRAAGCDPDATVLAAGFPCQDLSVAGGRRGMGRGTGTRSALYWHVDRLLGEFAPRWVILENVPGLLSSHRGRDMGAVLGSLADRGYGFAWRVLDAQHFGVPQRRRRVVIVGHLGAPWGAPAEVLLEPAGVSWDSAPLAGARTSAPGAAAGRVGGRRVASALTAHHGRMTAEDADNLVTFQKVIRSGDRDADGNLPPEVWAERSVSATLSPFDLASESRAVDLVAYPMALRGRAGGSACEIGESGDPAFALRAGDGGSSRSQLVAASVTGDRTHALTAGGHDASEDGTGRGCPVIAFQPQAAGDSAMSIDTTAPCLSVNQLAGVHTETVVRRLTPLECERLQGAPDGWTDGQADSPRYRQLGNAVAVPVFEWVARRLVAIDARITSEVAADSPTSRSTPTCRS
jgi:DNA (cytosine-5)-methyltransferase 1